MSFEIQRISGISPAIAIDSKIAVAQKPQVAQSNSLNPTAIAPFNPVAVELNPQHPDYVFQNKYENLHSAIRKHEPFFDHSNFVVAFETVAGQDWQLAKKWADKLPLSYQKMLCYTLLARLGNQGNVPELLEQIKKDPYIKNDPRFYPEMVVLEHYIKVPELTELTVA
jgi:hypothetical protein